jgi:hypothetical protein
VEEVAGSFGGVTQVAVDVAGLIVVALYLVETVALNVIVVHHAQGFPTEETRREAWMGLNSFQKDIGRTGMTWWSQ